VHADIRYEAAFLRGALLVGLIHERDVHHWAEALIEDGARLKPRAPENLETTLTDILSTPAELSAMREALYPLTKGVDPRRIGMALLAAMQSERIERPAEARVRMLGQIRAEFKSPPDIAAAIKKFENRLMFAAAGVATVTAPTAEEVIAFLDEVVRASGPPQRRGPIPYVTG
jgi:hypothetical protein